jgi:hypothetical protein
MTYGTKDLRLADPWLAGRGFDVSIARYHGGLSPQQPATMAVPSSPRTSSSHCSSPPWTRPPRDTPSLLLSTSRRAGGRIKPVAPMPGGHRIGTAAPPSPGEDTVGRAGSAAPPLPGEQAAGDRRWRRQTKRGRLCGRLTSGPMCQ